MDKNSLIQLTNKLYKLTLLFPKKEPLRYKIRELAADVLAGPNLEDLEVIISFFEVARTQNWVKVEDILAIQQEYDILKAELEKAQPRLLLEDGTKEFSQTMVFPGKDILDNSQIQSSSQMSERQDRIISFLRENGRGQVWQVKQILPEVTKRTLRRDFEHMLKQGLIERIGERNDTFYQVKIKEV